MYDDISKDLGAQGPAKPARRAPHWGGAIRSFLAEKSDTPGQPIPVSRLAQKAKLNEKNLHNIIAGRVRDPSSDKLVRIAEALGVSFSQLAARAMAEEAGNFHVCGYGDRGFVEYPQHGMSIQTFTPRARGHRDFFWGRMTIKAFHELRKWQFRENSTVGLFLETGTLEIVYGNKKHTLHANEAVYFDAGVPHKIKNIDSIEAKLFIVTSPSLF
ncbi:MAG: hypothetical protein A2Z83_00410 [Omnitrophica bacterium GWA2_52_8]|nr:MAG: hypothetical protein A2Z83_00410 [Omnitrophica bacterium GWA2_52_8]